MSMVERFCAQSERLEIPCRACAEFNSDGICDVRAEEQPYYRDFAMYDTVMIERTKVGTVRIGTDIEVIYDTPYDKWGKTGADFERELFLNEQKLGNEVRRRLPEWASLLRFHLHHNPNRLPETVALHIHTVAHPEDMVDAKRKALELIKVLNPRDIERAIGFKSRHRQS